jgi:hypothetical protein
MARQFRNDDNMQIQSPSSKSKATPTAATVSVYYDQHYIGHVLARGREGFEAYDHNEQSLGAFETEDEAATAIWKAAR